MSTLTAIVPTDTALPITCRLPAPFGSAASESQAAVIANLRSGNDCRLIAALLVAGRELSPAERPLAVWLPCIIGLDERARLGQPLAQTATILKFIRANLRGMLAKFPLDVRGRWLVPASKGDLTAVYAAALLLAHQGTVARPWIWDSLPPNDGFMTISTSRLETRNPPHSRCLGHTTLLTLYPRAAPMGLPVERPALRAVG